MPIPGLERLPYVNIDGGGSGFYNPEHPEFLTGEAAGDGVTSATSALQAAGVLGGNVLAPGRTYLVPASATIAGNIDGMMGIIKVPAGVTLTLTGNVVAGNWQVFDCIGWTRAAAVLTASANFANGETVTIGPYTYTFQTTLTNADKNVLIGATLAASLLNLAYAINTYIRPITGAMEYATITGFNSAVYAESTATTLTVTARTEGTGGNAYGVSETAANASWGTASLTGGVNGGSVAMSGAATGPVNVKWFGAGGVGLTNDEYAFNRAVRAASEKAWGAPGGEFSGAVVYTPGGRFMLDNAVHIASNAGVSFIGDAKTKSNIYPSPSAWNRAMPLLHFEGNNNYRGYVRWMRITGYNGGGGTTTGIRIDGNGNQIDILENWIDSHAHAIVMRPHSDSRIVGNTFEYNFNLLDMDGSDHIAITDNTIYTNGPIAAGGDDWTPTIKLTNCGHIMFQNNRVIRDLGLSTQLTGSIVFDNCTRCTISGNVEHRATQGYAPTLVMRSCDNMKVAGNVWGQSELQTVLIDGGSDILLQGNSYFGAHHESTVHVMGSATRVRLVAEDFGVIETYASAPATPVEYDVTLASCSNVILTGCTFSRGVVASSVAGLGIIGNDSVSFSTAGPGVRLTDCTRVRHMGNNWQTSSTNCMLIDGGSDITSVGNYYAGSSASYAVAVLQTVGVIAPTRIKFSGETFTAGGAGLADLAIFQSTRVIVEDCSGTYGVFVDVATTARVFLEESNDFRAGTITYYVVAPTSGAWLTRDRVPDVTKPGTGWACSAGGTPGTWHRFGIPNADAVHLTGSFRVECSDATLIGVYDSAATRRTKPTLAAYTSDPESVAYTAPAVIADAAKLTDINALRVAYETVRASHEDMRTKYDDLTLALQQYGWLKP